ncbi:hypothetical protein VOLCADRAFT_86385 [Volvox carteri f. nagariensis]|uniref:Uncharacterized protein n=1 Tax=Volvox carteri f. nagariensis TaxID=3068 RepID=D8TIM6_VOLCA|nr:uncharacterized protein VOLCADRAFT_86385 [Volvox carteri f. nagariensis]EFJ52914.1 hypothetical protein VOLCADRAFT_86385 [Volvox carteri f. nagariensis]|eukprot:XP_002945919.1 hypothetical protein VOLCADRAFT_86385 [Volvox carteri f. nagariensis]
MESKSHKKQRRKYRPLDVKTWFEGFLRLIGWILVIVLSVVTGGLFVFYEIKVLNRHDTDFRDMYFDQRITNDVNNEYHKSFLLAEQCSNPDPVYFSGQTALFPYSEPVGFPPWSGILPVCKPVIMIECTDIRTAACNSTRQALYDAVGMALIPGTPYINCLRAGRVRVGAMAVPAGRPISLVAYQDEGNPYDTLVINSPFEINGTQIQEFVDRVAAAANSNNTDYVQPSTQLSSGIYLAGVQVVASLDKLREENRELRAVPPWTVVSNLWPWPGMNKRCENTGTFAAYYITGSANITIPRFSLAHPDETVITLTVAGSSLLLGAWRVTPAAEPTLELGASTDVTVSYLSGVQVAIGQVPLLGPCGGWQFSPDPNDLNLTYTAHWTGSLADLQAGTSFRPIVNQVVTVNVLDVAAPRSFALPAYGGMYYIFGAFGMAFIWLVSNSLILFIIILVWWNIRSNKGLPPIIYRYMKKYRGW